MPLVVSSCYAPAAERVTLRSEAFWAAISRSRDAIPRGSRAEYSDGTEAPMKVTGLLLGAVLAAQVARPPVAGVTNFARLDRTIACAGAVTPDGVAEIKRLGYASIINLRQASEQGASVEAEAAAAQDAGLRYVNL